MYQKKLLINIRKDRGQLHVHAKGGTFSYAVRAKNRFFEKMTPLRQQKSYDYTEDLRAYVHGMHPGIFSCTLTIFSYGIINPISQM